ncbi:MAG: bifunctional DNA primase/polymerase [Dehalococcoidia bacterium]|nr:bifunctional DNA primase/polymerase [Dehalococcoidia bacterium]
MEAELYPIAWQLHNNGFSVIPSGGGDSGKHPLVVWTEFQHRQPTDSEMHTWQDEYRPSLWGVVTGTIIVFDCDTPAAAAPFEAVGLKPHVKTPRGGCHFYFKAPTENVKTAAGILPGLDVRGNGGFVNVCGHNHAGPYVILKTPSSDTLYDWDQVPAVVLEAMKAPQKPISRSDGSTIPQGQRNDVLTSLAGTMRRRGMEEAAIVAALLETNAAQCAPPLPEEEVRGIAASVVRYPPVPPTGNVNNVRTHIYERDTRSQAQNGIGNGTVAACPDNPEGDGNGTLADRVLEWVKGSAGWWSTAELDSELNIHSPEDKDNRKKILYRLRDKGVIERHLTINRQWRYVNKAVTALDILAAPKTGALPLKWPLGIEKHVHLFPGNIVGIAGAPNSGKTALLLDFIRLNMDRFPIYYWCSEMGSAELRSRLEQFPGMSIDDWKFKPFERASDFEDVLVPDAINIIDYLEMTEDVYRVNSYLTKYSHRIGSGLVVVAIQKKIGAQLGRGQEFSLEKPRLYLSMDRGKLTIIKGKSWANPKVDPNGLTMNFRITGGCVFEFTRDWEGK